MPTTAGAARLATVCQSFMKSGSKRGKSYEFSGFVQVKLQALFAHCARSRVKCYLSAQAAHLCHSSSHSLCLPLSLYASVCISLARPEVAEVFKQLALISPAVTWSLPSLSFSSPVTSSGSGSGSGSVAGSDSDWLRADGTSLATVARLKPVKCFYANFITFSCCCCWFYGFPTGRRNWRPA